MKLLFTLDKKDYTDDMLVFERYGVRAIIRQDHKFAMQRSRTGEYKLPGGGMEVGETYEQALVREVREETGLQVKTETIKEIGEVLELKEDIKCKGQKYIAHSYFYECEVSTEMVETELTASEIEHGYELVWADLDEIISGNENWSEDWINRDTEFLKRFYVEN